MNTLEDIPLNDKKTWELISSGQTKGVFQLESPLGRSFCKKISPKNVQELSDVIAIIRPGSLEAFIGEKTVTQHYVDRKNGTENVEYPHEVLEPALKDTYGLLVYQEQAIEICKIVGGFNLKQADELRKAAGKKDTDLMSKVEATFIEGVRNTGILKEDIAKSVWQNIRASQRYAFNRSHSIAYALLGYHTAYIKANYPYEFFISWLAHAKLKIDPIEELEALVNDARLGGIDVKPPDFRNVNTQFESRGGAIYFGFDSVRSFGEASLSKLTSAISGIEETLGKPRGKWSWLDFLVYYSDEINKTSVEALVRCGALDYTRKPRKLMDFEYNVWSKLTDKEKQWCKDNCEEESLIELLERAKHPKKEGGGAANKNRTAFIGNLIITLKRPPTNLQDTGSERSDWERKYLGVPVSATSVEDYDDLEINCTCYMFANKQEVDANLILGVEILKVREHQIKNGQSKGQIMMFLTVQDETATISNVTVFPDGVEAFSGLLKDRSVVYLLGVRDYKFGTLNVSQVHKMQPKNHNLWVNSDSEGILTSE